MSLYDEDDILIPQYRFYMEENRLNTFKDWRVTFLSPTIMARAGFYYIGRGDEVRCAFCKVEIMNWKEGDDPEQEHDRWAPHCKRKPKSSSKTEYNLYYNDRLLTKPQYPEYAKKEARLESFNHPKCPSTVFNKRNTMVQAGFFYTGLLDKVKCFYCALCLGDWEDEDDPWNEHAKWFMSCSYVHLKKGNEFVQRVITEKCAINIASTSAAAAPSTTTTNTNESKNEENVCKICLVNERDTCIMPCRHFIMCMECSSKLRNCPICRCLIKDYFRVYVA